MRSAKERPSRLVWSKYARATMSAEWPSAAARSCGSSARAGSPALPRSAFTRQPTAARTASTLAALGIVSASAHGLVGAGTGEGADAGRAAAGVAGAGRGAGAGAAGAGRGAGAVDVPGRAAGVVA